MNVDDRQVIPTRDEWQLLALACEAQSRTQNDHAWIDMHRLCVSNMYAGMKRVETNTQDNKETQ